MTFDRGYDSQQQSYAIIDQIQRAAWDGKEDLVNAPDVQNFSLHGLTESDIHEVPVVGGNRIAIPGVTGRLTFDSMNLLSGILAGDSLGEGDQVKVYYPHLRGGELKGKTVFQMTLSEAATLLKKTAAAHEIDINLVKQAVMGMSTRFSMFEQSQFDLHSHDIGMALIDKI